MEAVQTLTRNQDIEQVLLHPHHPHPTRTMTSETEEEQRHQIQLSDCCSTQAVISNVFLKCCTGAEACLL